MADYWIIRKSDAHTVLHHLHEIKSVMAQHLSSSLKEIDELPNVKMQVVNEPGDEGIRIEFDDFSKLSEFDPEIVGETLPDYVKEILNNSEHYAIDKNGRFVDGHLRVQAMMNAQTFLSRFLKVMQDEKITTFNPQNQTTYTIHFEMQSFATVFTHMMELCMRAIHETAVAKGWWETERSDADTMILFHSEISEAVEAHRIHNPTSEKIPDFTQVEEELADCIIRILDYAGKKDFDIGGAIVEKMRYNNGRSYRHGGKAL